MDTSADIRRRIILLHESGNSTRQISRMLLVPQSTVSDLIRHHSATGSTSTNRAGRCGRPPRVNLRTRRMLARYSIANPRSSARQVMHAFGGECPQMSLRHMQRQLKLGGAIPYRPLKSPTLNTQQRQARYQWCLDHRDWSVADWGEVIFSDECSFAISPQANSQFVRRRRGAPVTSEHTTSHRPFLQRIMIWSCISRHGAGPLVVVDGNMNATKYVNIMQQHLLPQIVAWYGAVANCGYQQDNAPCHKAAIATRFLAQNRIPIVPWPPYSPDLNCIENVWAVLKAEFRAQPTRSREHAVERLEDIWRHSADIQRTITAVINSMPRRIERCIASRGGYIPY